MPFFLRTCIAFLATSLPCIASNYQLETTFAAGNGQKGNYLQVNVSNQSGITVTALTGNFKSSGTVTVWRRDGSIDAAKNSNQGWTQVASASISTSGIQQKKFDTNFQLSSGNHTLLFVNTGDVKYTNASFGSVAASDNNIAILVGYGTARTNPSGTESTYTGRKWNGIIHYSIGAVPTHPPSITQGQSLSLTTLEDSIASTTPNALSATDPDTIPSDLSWSLLTSPTNGSAVIDGNGSSPSSFSYTPNPNFYGSDIFSAKVSDGDSNDTITINVTVNAIDDPAIITGDFNATINEDGVANGDLNAVDIEGLTDNTYFTITTAPTHGAQPFIRAPGNWTYTPNANYFGNDAFQVTVTDDLQGTTPALLQITVNSS